MRKYIAMIFVMVALLFVYFLLSGTFDTEAPFSDVVSMSDEEVIEDGGSWKLHIPENRDRSQYVTYEGDEVGIVSVSLEGTIWYLNEETGEEISEHVERDLWLYEYFYFGEKRWRIRENFEAEEGFEISKAWLKVEYLIDEKPDFNTSFNRTLSKSAYITSSELGTIERETARAADAARAELLVEADSFIAYNGDLAVTIEEQVFVTECYVAGNGTGMVVTVKSKSFGGLLTAMIAINSDGQIDGVKVTDHADTPGLGTKAMTEEHLAQYEGLEELTSENVKEDQDVEYISGASISSGAIHEAVYCALEQYEIVNE